jgi:hypothetical protein
MLHASMGVIRAMLKQLAEEGNTNILLADALTDILENKCLIKLVPIKKGEKRGKTDIDEDEKRY